MIINWYIHTYVSQFDHSVKHTEFLLPLFRSGLVILALCLSVIGLALMHGPQAALFSELFGTRVRYSGASLGYKAPRNFRRESQ